MYNAIVDQKAIKVRLLRLEELQIENVNVNKRKDKAILRHNNNKANCNTVSLYKKKRHLSNLMLISRYNVNILYNPNSLVAAKSENKGNALFARSLLIYKVVVVYKTIVTY